MSNQSLQESPSKFQKTFHLFPNIDINFKKKIIIEEVSEANFQSNMEALYEYSTKDKADNNMLEMQSYTMSNTQSNVKIQNVLKSKEPFIKKDSAQKNQTLITFIQDRIKQSSLSQYGSFKSLHQENLREEAFSIQQKQNLINSLLSTQKITSPSNILVNRQNSLEPLKNLQKRIQNNQIFKSQNSSQDSPLKQGISKVLRENETNLFEKRDQSITTLNTTKYKLNNYQGSNSEISAMEVRGLMAVTIKNRHQDNVEQKDKNFLKISKLLEENKRKMQKQNQQLQTESSITEKKENNSQKLQNKSIQKLNIVNMEIDNKIQTVKNIPLNSYSSQIKLSGSRSLSPSNSAQDSIFFTQKPNLSRQIPIKIIPSQNQLQKKEEKIPYISKIACNGTIVSKALPFQITKQILTEQDHKWIEILTQLGLVNNIRKDQVKNLWDIPSKANLFDQILNSLLTNNQSQNEQQVQKKTEILKKLPDIKKSMLLEQILIEKSNIGKDLMNNQGMTELETQDSIDMNKNFKKVNVLPKIKSSQRLQRGGFLQKSDANELHQNQLEKEKYNSTMKVMINMMNSRLSQEQKSSTNQSLKYLNSSTKNLNQSQKEFQFGNDYDKSLYDDMELQVENIQKIKRLNEKFQDLDLKSSRSTLQNFDSLFRNNDKNNSSLMKTLMATQSSIIKNEFSSSNPDIEKLVKPDLNQSQRLYQRFDQIKIKSNLENKLYSSVEKQNQDSSMQRMILQNLPQVPQISKIKLNTQSQIIPNSQQAQQKLDKLKKFKLDQKLIQYKESCSLNQTIANNFPFSNNSTQQSKFKKMLSDSKKRDDFQNNLDKILNDPIKLETNFQIEDNSQKYMQKPFQNVKSKIPQKQEPQRDKDYPLGKTRFQMIQNQINLAHKVKQFDSMLNEIVNDMKLDSISQARMQQSRDDIEQQVIVKYNQDEKDRLSLIRNNNKNSNDSKNHSLKYKQKNNRDFDVLHFKKFKNFTDHQGNFITITGHKIDDYLIGAPKVFNDENSCPASKSPKISIKQQNNNKQPMGMKKQFSLINLKKINSQQHSIIKEENYPVKMQKMNTSFDKISDNQNQMHQKSLKQALQNIKIVEMDSESSILQQQSVSKSNEDTFFQESLQQSPNQQSLDVSQKKKIVSSVPEIVNQINHNLTSQKFDQKYKIINKKEELSELIEQFAKEETHQIFQIKFNPLKIQIDENIAQQLKYLFTLIRKKSANQNESLLEKSNLTASRLYNSSITSNKNSANKVCLEVLDLGWCQVKSNNLIKKILDSLVEQNEVLDQDLQNSSSLHSSRQTDDRNLKTIFIKKLSLAGLKMQHFPISLILFIKSNLQILEDLDISFSQQILPQINIFGILSILKLSENLKYINISHTALGNKQSHDCILYIIENNINLKCLDISFTSFQKPWVILQILRDDQNAIGLENLHVDGLNWDGSGEDLSKEYQLQHSIESWAQEFNFQNKQLQYFLNYEKNQKLVSLQKKDKSNRGIQSPIKRISRLLNEPCSIFTKCQQQIEVKIIDQLNLILNENENQTIDFSDIIQKDEYLNYKQSWCLDFICQHCNFLRPFVILYKSSSIQQKSNVNDIIFDKKDLPVLEIETNQDDLNLRQIDCQKKVQPMIPMRIFLMLINSNFEDYPGWMKIALEDIVNKYTEQSDSYNRLKKVILLNEYIQSEGQINEWWVSLQYLPEDLNFVISLKNE